VLVLLVVLVVLVMLVVLVLLVLLVLVGWVPFYRIRVRQATGLQADPAGAQWWVSCATSRTAP